MNDEMGTSQFSVRLPDYVIAALRELADRERRTLSNMIRVILEERLEAPKGDSHV